MGLLYVLSLFFPWLSGPPTSVDASWEMVLHRATEQHWQFGKDIIFTFGPWGFLYGGYSPATHSVCAAIWMCLALVFWCAAWKIARHFSSNTLIAWIWFMLFAGLAGMRVEQTVDVKATAWSLLALCLYFYVEDKPISSRQAVLAFSAGLLGLVKFTCFIQFGLIFTIIGLDVLFRRKRFPWITILYFTAIVVFWLIAGQNHTMLGLYLRYSVAIAGGYTSAMMSSGEGEGFYLSVMLISMAVLVFVMGRLAFQRYAWFSVLPTAAIAGVLFLVFKLGNVRFHPIHETTTTLQLTVATLACLAMAWPAIKSQRWWMRLALCSVLAGITLFGSHIFSNGYRKQGFEGESLWLSYAWTLNWANLTIPTKLLKDPKYLEKKHEKYLHDIRSEFPLPAIEGSVDVYPWRHAVVFAHGLDYNPRPIIQSYSAYTPALLELNSRHLQTKSAPQNVLFGIDPQNNNYPTLEDGLSWLDLLTRYEVVGNTPQFAILKKTPRPKSLQLKPMTNTPVELGVPLMLTTNHGLVWAELDFQRTFKGSLLSLLYKPEKLLLMVGLKNGEQRFYTLVPGMAKTGFLLSPLIVDNNAFICAATGTNIESLDGQQVASATILAATPSGKTSDYHSTVKWRLSLIEFMPRVTEQTSP